MASLLIAYVIFTYWLLDFSHTKHMEVATGIENTLYHTCMTVAKQNEILLVCGHENKI